MPDDDFLRELNEFYNCARIFKPMTGFMASRFTTAKTTSSMSTDGQVRAELLSKPEAKVTDPAEEAAKVGMFGKLTRSVEDFFPTRLLCKRFNVRAPEHTQPDNDSEMAKGGRARSSFERAEEPVSAALSMGKAIESAPSTAATDPATTGAQTGEAQVGINPEKNDALEGKAAHDEVLRAIFGDSDSE